MITFESKDVINPTAFKEVLLIGGVKGATVRLAADKGLLVLVLRIGEENRILGQYRGGARYFRTVDGAASVLIQHGIYQFNAELTGWTPRTLARSRGGDLLESTGDKP
ncbi:TPA: partition protein [Klebsiella oxytoca]|nr:partition protein [Klebsiella oxytoca]